MNMSFVPFHQHLIIKGYFSEPPRETAILNIWFKELVAKVGMQVVAGPTSVYVDEIGNEGLTGTVTLATSHASIHIWDNDKPSLFQFDIYSCKKFSVVDVLEHLDEFGLKRCEWVVIDRNSNLTITDSGHEDNDK
jgi:S-adenosylmethionine/arginine decarboxylase-like enzyme